ncbi:hypothetical protein AAKU64_002973, partial [Undibacterium sp. GrIS 1.8]
MSQFPALQAQLTQFASNAASGLLSQFSGEFSSDTRLYDFSLQNAEQVVDFGSGGLLVEGFAAQEALHSISTRDVILLSTNPSIKLSSLLTQTASLHISLSDGT